MVAFTNNMAYTSISIEELDSSLDRIHEAFSTDGFVIICNSTRPREISDVSNFLNKQKSSVLDESTISVINSAIQRLIEGFSEKIKPNALSTWVVYRQLTGRDLISIRIDLTRTINLDRIDGILLTVGAALQEQSSGRYIIPKVISKVPALPQRPPKSIDETKQELKRLFEAIDGSLMFYQATSVSEITFELLSERVKYFGQQSLTLEKLKSILAVFPGAYTVATLRGSQYTIACGQLPDALERRRVEFANLIESVSFPLQTVNLPELTPKRANILADRLSLKRSMSPALAKINAGSLLDRIRAKEQQKLSENPEELKKQRHEKFITSHCSRVAAVLVAMKTKQSYAIEHVIRILADSMPPQHRLSKREASDVLHVLATKAPEFCSIVHFAAGPKSVEAIKISAGWTASRVAKLKF